MKKYLKYLLTLAAMLTFVFAQAASDITFDLSAYNKPVVSFSDAKWGWESIASISGGESFSAGQNLKIYFIKAPTKSVQAVVQSNSGNGTSTTETRETTTTNTLTVPLTSAMGTNITGIALQNASGETGCEAIIDKITIEDSRDNVVKTIPLNTNNRTMKPCIRNDATGWSIIMEFSGTWDLTDYESLELEIEDGTFTSPQLALGSPGDKWCAHQIDVDNNKFTLTIDKITPDEGWARNDVRTVRVQKTSAGYFVMKSLTLKAKIPTPVDYKYDDLEESDLESMGGKITWRPSETIYKNTYTENNYQYFATGDDRKVPSTDVTINDGTADYPTVKWYFSDGQAIKLKKGNKYKLTLYYKCDAAVHPRLALGMNSIIYPEIEIQNSDWPTGSSETQKFEYTFTIGETDNTHVLWISATGYSTPLYYGGFDLELVDDECVKGNDVTLTTITDHRLWKGTANLTAGNTFDDRFVYRGNGATYIAPTSATNTYVNIDDYVTNSSTTAQGSNGIYRADGHDHWGMKVASGDKKIGSIKVYYKANNSQINMSDGNIKFADGKTGTDRTNLVFNSEWQCLDLIWYYATEDWSDYQYVKVEFEHPTVIPLKLSFDDDDDDTPRYTVQIPKGSTEIMVYIGEGRGLDLTTMRHLMLQAIGGFNDEDFEGDDLSEDTNKTNRTQTIKLKGITLYEAPVIAKGTSENTLPHKDADTNLVYLTPTLETRSNGTEVMVYGFNHESEASDICYWISGVSSVVRIGAIEVIFDETRHKAAFDPAKLETTKINEIPLNVGNITVDSDGHRTLKWRVNDYKEDNVIYTNSYYQPASGGLYYQYIYNSNSETASMPVTTQSATAAGTDARDLETIKPTNNTFGQVFKLEPNTMYRITLYTVKNEAQTLRFVNSKGIGEGKTVNVLSNDGFRYYRSNGDGKTVIEFVTDSNNDNCYFWILGRKSGTDYDNYAGFDLTYLQTVTDRSVTNTYEVPESKDGTSGEYYWTYADKYEKAFPIQPRVFAPTSSSTDGIYNPDTDSNRLILKNGTTPTMNVMLGTDDTYIWRTENNVPAFYRGGLKWKDMSSQSNNGGYLDGRKTYTPGDHNAHGGDQDSGNANPLTECNGGIGGPYTEGGGMFLQPVSGDFFRFEPKYDGIVTVWFLQNGNTDGDTYQTFDLDGNGKVKTESDGTPILEPNRGNLTRRPVYIVDENGKIMTQSTVKPDNDYSKGSHYAINGSWAYINDFAWLRDDFSKGWALAVERWFNYGKTSNETKYYYNGKYATVSSELAQRYKETILFYSHWFDGGTYHYNTPTNTMTLHNIDVHRSNLDGKSDDKTTYVNETMLTGMIIYRNNVLYNLENTWNCRNADNFAKYGYEVPNHLNVRYVIPVRAGKTYYIGGRGTKNGFSSVKFEPMPANYKSADYINNSLNYNVEYPNNNNGKYVLSAISSSGSHANDTYNATTNINSYADVDVLTISDTNGIVWTNKSGNALSTAPAVGTTVHAKVNRTFSVNKWHPIVLPFSVSESKMRELFGAGVKVLYLDPYDHAKNGSTGNWASVYAPAVNSLGDTENTLHFTRHYYQMLYANTPAFICPSEVNSNNVYDFGYVYYSGTTINSYNIGGKYKVTGSYTATAVGSGPMYYISNTDGKAIVYHSSTGVAMKPGRVWIVPNESGVYTAPLRTVSFGTYDGYELEGTEQSGIEDIVMDDMVIDMYNDDNVYDLMGRMVGHGSLNGLTPGIYIFHGQKHYVR